MDRARSPLSPLARLSAVLIRRPRGDGNQKYIFAWPDALEIPRRCLEATSRSPILTCCCCCWWAASKTMIQDSACALLSHRIEPEALTQPLQLFASCQDTTPLQDTN